MIPISKRQCAHFYKFNNRVKNKTLICIYKKPVIFSKSKTIYVTFFIHKTPDTLHYTNFYEIFEIYIYIYTKIMKLCVSWRFYVQKARNFEQKQENLCYVFYIPKISHFFIPRSSLIFGISEGGGVYMNKKRSTSH